MRISTKLALGYGILLALLGGLVVFHVSSIHANAEAGRRLSSLTSRLVSSAADQRYWLDRMEESASKYRITGDEGYARRLGILADRYDEALHTMARQEMTPEEARARTRLETLWLAFRRRVPAIAPLPGGDGGAPGGTGGEGRPRDAVADRAPSSASPVPDLADWFADLRRRTEALAAATRGAVAAEVTAADRRARRAEAVAWAGVGGAVLLSVGVWFFVVHSIAGGLRRLTEGTRRVADGDFEHRLPADGGDEFAELARSFNRMTERLAELDQLKRDFLSRISHDLKSPLASMQETNNLLLDGLAGDLGDDARHLLELSQKNSERLSAMISKLLDVARLQGEAEIFHFHEDDLAERIRAVTERVEPAYRQAGVELEPSLPEGRVGVVCDGEWVDQLLENLLENARRYTPEEGAVEVRLERCGGRPSSVPVERWSRLDGAGSDGGAVLLTVSDQGPGVPEGERDSVFEQFFQSSQGGGGAGGVGLGLTLCREVAEAHGGTIWVEGRPGGGSRFRVLLPVRPVAARDREEDPERDDAVPV